VSVKTAIVLGRLIIPSFSIMKLEVVGSSIFMVETELVASSKTFVSVYQTSYS